MLFGLFFGAGNLIFPVHLGQEAGSLTPPAVIGFIITATGLPFLGALAIGISNCGGLFGLASRVGKGWGYFFTIALFLTIGPFFAHPRTGTVSYEVGFALYMPERFQSLGLFLFSLLFFGAALLISLRPGKIIVWVGKVLNPLFLFFLGILLATSFLHPMGRVADAPVHGAYMKSAFFTGFVEGYNTMDALAALAFGMLVVDALKAMGVTRPRDIAVSTAKAGAVSVLLMVIIYTCLSFMGAMSIGQFELSRNGGIALAQVARHYFGFPGSVLLACIVTLACMKTAIGLTTSCSAIFVTMFPNSLSYRAYVFLFSGLACAIANVGLTQIIALSIPVLMFLYPPAMVLILLALFSSFFADARVIYLTSTAAAAIFSIGDALAATPAVIRDLAPVKGILAAHQALPLADIGMGWVFPALIGFALGLTLYCRQRKHAPTNKVSQ